REVGGKRLVVELVEHDVGEHLAAPRQRRPFELVRQAVGADVADRVAYVGAGAAPLQLELALPASLPARAVLVGDRRQRLPVIGHGHPLRNIVTLDVLRAAPRPVTRQTSASLTWRSPHAPRIWRTPSTMCSHPSM